MAAMAKTGLHAMMTLATVQIFSRADSISSILLGVFSFSVAVARVGEAFQLSRAKEQAAVLRLIVGPLQAYGGMKYQASNVLNNAGYRLDFEKDKE